MTKNKETVCAVVVTYNRKRLLLECLEAIRRQTRAIEGIYIIDNASTDGTPEILLKEEYIRELPCGVLSEPWEKKFEVNNLINGEPIKLYYVRMHKNTGGAGGFYEGVKRAYERGYDWLWLMDDDAEPLEDSLEKLEKFFNEDQVVVLSSSVVLANGHIAFNHRGTTNLRNIFPLVQKPIPFGKYRESKVEITVASFVGFLVSRHAIDKVGFPRKDFFIHHDDVEYCIRLQRIGKIFLVPKSIIIHKEAAKHRIEKNFLWKKSIRVPYGNFWLTYFGRRNLVWLGRTYSLSKLNFYFGIIKNFIRSIVGVLLFDDNKVKRIRFIVNAYIDGLEGTFDNKKPKRILYGEKDKI